MFRQFVKVLLLVVAFSIGARAQIGRATILGSVVDSSGASVAGAAIRLRHLETDRVYNTNTNESGLYTMSGLPVGSYEVDAVASGFKRAVRRGIVLEVDDRPAIDFRLEIGAVTESVEVIGSAPLVDIDSATVGKVIENTRMTNLPVAGRTALSMILLTPNVRGLTVNAPGFGDRGAAVSNFSLNGSPSAMNAIVLDGTTNNTPRNGDISVNPTVDAIQEFKVQSGIMQAEYGYTLGGVINLVTKSGTNTLHGTLYEFLRNSDLDARNTFAATKAPLRYNQYGGTISGPIRKNRTFYFFNYEEWRLAQAYTVIGITPTVLERSGDFSQTRTSSGAAIPLYNPGSVRPNPSGAGFVSDPFPGNILPPAQLDKAAQNVLTTFYPMPNQTPTNAFTNANNFQANHPAYRRARQEAFKVDHTLTSKDSLSFRYVLWDHKDDNALSDKAMWPSPLASTRNDDYSNRNANLSDIHTFSPTQINEFRVGLLRQVFSCLGPSYNKGWPQKLGMAASVPGTVLPRVNISGYAGFPSSLATYYCLIAPYTLQLVDNVTVNWGKHSIKFGLDLRRSQYNRSQNSNPSGTFTFNSTLTGNLQQPAGTGIGLASFLLGAVATATAMTDEPVTFRGFSQGYYVQDDWRVTHRFTLNLGLRWDLQQYPSETFNRMSNFDPYVRNPKDGVLGKMDFAGLDFSGSITKPAYKNFSPRVGFAVNVFGDGKTAIRGGYGIYYPMIFTSVYFPDTSAGFNSSSTTYQGPGGSTQFPAFQFQQGFPSPPIQPVGANLGPSGLESQAVSYILPNNRTPYSQQWTLTVQHQLPHGLLLESGYSGNKGTRLATATYDLNQLAPQYYSLGQALNQQVPNPYAGQVGGAFGGATIAQQQALRPYPYYGNINVKAQGGSSTYHSWLLNLEKRMSNGLVLLASYTFGKLINENVLATSGAQSAGEQLNTGNGYRLGTTNRRLERSLDPTDSANNFVFSGVYELPLGSGKRWQTSSGVLNGLIGGWQINSVATLRNGLPLVIRGANNSLADRPNSTGASARLSNPTERKWFDTAAFVNPPSFTIGNVARTLPDVRCPGVNGVDFSMMKNTKIHERWNLQFRAELFNVVNHVNLLGPDTTFVPGADGKNISSTFGTITSARDARLVQLGLKLLF